MDAWQYYHNAPMSERSGISQDPLGVIPDSWLNLLKPSPKLPTPKPSQLSARQKAISTRRQRGRLETQGRTKLFRKNGDQFRRISKGRLIKPTEYYENCLALANLLRIPLDDIMVALTILEHLLTQRGSSSTGIRFKD